jgi:hypothetical protein
MQRYIVQYAVYGCYMDARRKRMVRAVLYGGVPYSYKFGFDQTK